MNSQIPKSTIKDAAEMVFKVYAQGVQDGITLAAQSASCDGVATKEDVEKVKEELMAKVSSLAATLGKVGDTLDKIKVEVQTLADKLADVDLPDEAQAQLDRVIAVAEAIDALNPDAPTT